MPAQNRGELWPKNHFSSLMQSLPWGRCGWSHAASWSSCIYMAGRGNVQDKDPLGPHQDLEKKRPLPRPELGQRRGHSMGDTPVFDFDFVRWFPHLSSGLQSRIFHAETGHFSPHVSCGLEFRIFHAGCQNICDVTPLDRPSHRPNSHFQSGVSIGLGVKKKKIWLCSSSCHQPGIQSIRCMYACMHGARCLLSGRQESLPDLEKKIKDRS